MNGKQRDDLYQIVRIVEEHNQKKELNVELIKPYLNEYITLREIQKNSFITREERDLSKVYYIISGSYDMTRVSDRGKVKVQAKKKAPQFIGIGNAVDKNSNDSTNSKGNFTSVALQRCVILEINQDYFVECVKSNGELALIVIKNLSVKLVITSLEVDRLIFNDSKEQLMHYIYQHWSENSTGTCVHKINEKNGYTADNVGLSIRTFYRTLNVLKESGFISVKKGFIEVTRDQIEKIGEYLSR